MDSRRLLPLVALLILEISCVVAHRNPPIVTAKDVFDATNHTTGESLVRRQVDLGHHIIVNYDIEVTSKGNGVLHAPGINVKVYDDHDNGSVIEGGLATVVLVDMNEDGVKDLIISGTQLIKSDNDSLPRNVVRHEFCEVYWYSMLDMRFHRFDSGLLRD